MKTLSGHFLYDAYSHFQSKEIMIYGFLAIDSGTTVVGATYCRGLEKVTSCLAGRKKYDVHSIATTELSKIIKVTCFQNN